MGPLIDEPGRSDRMRMSGLFGRTLREDPADAELPSHKLLMRAAFIRPLAAGIYQTLPLGQRTMARIETILKISKARLIIQHDLRDFAALPKFPEYLN